MASEMEMKIKLLEEKMSKCEVGSIQQIMYLEILGELNKKLQEENGGKIIKMHVADEGICESCQ